MDSSADLSSRIARFAAYLQADPDNLSLLMELGDAEHRAGRFDTAYERFARAASLAPGNHAARANMAAVRLSQHRFADAAALYEALLSDGDDAPALHHNLGLALFYLDRFEDATGHLELAAGHGAANPRLLAHCYHHLGRLEDAVRTGEEWARQAPESDAEAAGYVALLYFDQGERDKARAAAEQALARQPDSIDAHAVRGALALEDQDIEAASASFGTILARRPDYGRAWLGMGLTHLYHQKGGDAVAAMERAVELMPGHAGTLVALGWTRLTAGDADKAEQAFRAAVEADRNFAESHGGLAAALVHLRRFDEAQSEIVVANRLNPANFGAVYAKAALLKFDGREALADRLIARALEQRPVEGAPSLLEYLTTFLTNRPSKGNRA